jgi:hypothetical protein
VASAIVEQEGPHPLAIHLEALLDQRTAKLADYHAKFEALIPVTENDTNSCVSLPSTPASWRAPPKTAPRGGYRRQLTKNRSPRRGGSSQVI